MLIHDGIFNWSGWGGKLGLGSGKCRLRIYDLDRGDEKGLTHLKPIVVVVSDLPESNVSVRSCNSHVATVVAKDFNIAPHRMLFIEYYPEKTYGAEEDRVISEKFDLVEFTWHQDKAIQPKWKSLAPPLLEKIKNLLND
ncbi:MAG: hypothetical protein JSV38_00225 [Desulfobacterales bacterium]|nr:MAG: hypothetical protein JSV38_00225 [Desulfobacterales bacterium]